MTGRSGSLLHRFAFAVGVRLTRLSLRRLGFSRTVTILDRLPRRPIRHDPVPHDSSRWASEIDRVGGRPYGASCLDRSVFLWFVMRRHGFDAQIRIGVAFDDDHLDGHAWVESDGRVVNDDPDVADRFAVFDEDPTGIVFS